MSFQKQVNVNPAPAVEGDFAGANPRTSVPAGPGGFVVGENPLIVGHFAWGNPETGIAEGNADNGGIIGFIHRENQTIITEFLGESRMSVQAGFPITLMGQGEFWARFPDGAEVGDTVYANDETGAPQIDPTGGTDTGYKVASAGPGELYKISTWI